MTCEIFGQNAISMRPTSDPWRRAQSTCCPHLPTSALLKAAKAAKILSIPHQNLLQANLMKDQIRILELASRGALPDQIDEGSDIPVLIVRELVQAGYLTAIDTSSLDGYGYLEPRITIPGREYLRRLRQREADAPEKELISEIERLRDMLVAVATGGPRIDAVNDSYRELFTSVDAALRDRSIDNAIPYPDLWDWYGRWKSGDLPSYQSRRQFISELVNPLIAQVRQHAAGKPTTIVEPTGWPRVDRTMGEVRRRLAEADSEEQFQAVGLLCREVLISLAQAVHDPKQHPPIDDKIPSETDAKRMLEAYIAVSLAGSSHEVARRHARAAYDLAVDLQHRRTAIFRQAAMCVEATSSVVNVIAIASGQRDPADT